MFTLYTKLIPNLQSNGIEFRYIGDVYNPMTIIVMYKNLDICRVDMNRNLNESCNYYVYWFPSTVKNARCLKRKYSISEELIDDIRREIDLNFKGEDKMNNKIYHVSDIEFNSSRMDEINITVNVMRPCAIREDVDRIREAIESIGERNESYYVGGIHLGKTYSWRNEYQKERDKFDIKDVIFNNPATIVLWADGTKTVVKAENEEFDPEKGLAMAISKRALGGKYDYYDTFKKYVGKYEKKQKKGGK